MTYGNQKKENREIAMEKQNQIITSLISKNVEKEMNDAVMRETHKNVSLILKV